MDTLPLVPLRHCWERGAQDGTLHASERPDLSWAGLGHTGVSGGRMDRKPVPSGQRERLAVSPTAWTVAEETRLLLCSGSACGWPRCWRELEKDFPQLFCVKEAHGSVNSEAFSWETGGRSSWEQVIQTGSAGASVSTRGGLVPARRRARRARLASRELSRAATPSRASGAPGTQRSWSHAAGRPQTVGAPARGGRGRGAILRRCHLRPGGRQ